MHAVSLKGSTLVEAMRYFLLRERRWCTFVKICTGLRLGQVEGYTLQELKQRYGEAWLTLLKLIEIGEVEERFGDVYRIIQQKAEDDPRLSGSEFMAACALSYLLMIERNENSLHLCITKDYWCQYSNLNPKTFSQVVTRLLRISIVLVCEQHKNSYQLLQTQVQSCHVSRSAPRMIDLSREEVVRNWQDQFTRNKKYKDFRRGSPLRLYQAL